LENEVSVGALNFEFIPFRGHKLCIWLRFVAASIANYASKAGMHASLIPTVHHERELHTEQTQAYSICRSTAANTAIDTRYLAINDWHVSVDYIYSFPENQLILNSTLRHVDLHYHHRRPHDAVEGGAP
jgi:hypothetical protein